MKDICKINENSDMTNVIKKYVFASVCQECRRLVSYTSSWPDPMQRTRIILFPDHTMFNLHDNLIKIVINVK